MEPAPTVPPGDPSSEQKAPALEEFLEETEKTEPESPLSPSWENPRFARGPISLLLTTAEVLLVPGRAFRRIHHDGHWGPPLAFYLIGCIVGWLCFFQTAFLLAEHDPNVPAKMLENFQQLPKQSWITLLAPSFVLSGMLGPIILLGAACCLHGALTLSGAARRPLASTYRLTAYLMGSLGMALSLLPVAVRIAVASGHPEKSGAWASNCFLFLGIWIFLCALRAASTVHEAGTVRVLASLLTLLIAAILPPFLFLLKIAELAAMGS
jgi:hypothetical protein